MLELKKYRSRFEVEILTAQAEMTGVIWFVQSFVLFVPLFIGLFIQNIWVLGLWFVGIILYWFVPVGIIYMNLKKLEIISGKSISDTNPVDFILSTIFGFYILLTHSVGPILCAMDFILAKLINKPITKLKTER